MGMNKISKLLGLNIGIAAALIVVFSPGLIGLKIGGASVFSTALGCAIVFVCAVLFLYGNYKMLTEKERIVQTKELDSPSECAAALRLHRQKKTFAETIDLLLGQIERIEEKQDTITDVLQQKFCPTEISFQKFQAVVTEVTDIFYINIKGIINRLNAFDEKDYIFITRKAGRTLSEEFREEKLSVYHDHMAFVSNAAQQNEQILLKLDKLLLEISKLTSLESNAIENMPGMEELNNLIKQVKFYR
ncbi:hypothetical protein LPY66_17495 [Dehalobacter sp. DCM]|uniref:hypothetical protein n=1 Tax=Dehalobacter sp. DCM TaxID=2907827 RepID=UPI00308215DC|nr:hypothetical protein LPY66_17495 [Dehalobacter sp. DCM]